MYRLFSLSALLFLVSADPRTPKIYNVLISTKKNLSPSHALPVYEPVLRTTSLGIALPPYFYQSPIATFEPNFVATPQKVGKPENEEFQRALQPLPVERFIPYAYAPHVLNNQGYYTPVAETQPDAKPKTLPEEIYQNNNDPKHEIANLKRNPDIPDVPPPALPTRNTT
ncbi:uncharacterized protein LOC123006496 [Tribolium madens]|uniref:uncharacterized protein LOC123006496 n=1 Tax=Tribolium madens TaxID=41895 RepID=UPI001CF75D26|nr:uncharacterized protein LOC123006496 [Tribolium madens]